MIVGSAAGCVLRPFCQSPAQLCALCHTFIPRLAARAGWTATPSCVPPTPARWPPRSPRWYGWTRRRRRSAQTQRCWTLCRTCASTPSVRTRCCTTAITPRHAGTPSRGAQGIPCCSSWASLPVQRLVAFSPSIGAVSAATSTSYSLRLSGTVPSLHPPEIWWESSACLPPSILILHRSGGRVPPARGAGGGARGAARPPRPAAARAAGGGALGAPAGDAAGGCCEAGLQRQPAAAARVPPARAGGVLPGYCQARALPAANQQQLERKKERIRPLGVD